MKSEEEIPKNYTREPTKTKPNKYACKQNEKDKEGKVYIFKPSAIWNWSVTYCSLYVKKTFSKN